MPHPYPAGQALTARRKRALDETDFITYDADADERNRTTAHVQRPRTSSIETHGVRPTIKAKLPWGGEVEADRWNYEAIRRAH